MAKKKAKGSKTINKVSAGDLVEGFASSFVGSPYVETGSYTIKGGSALLPKRLYTDLDSKYGTTDLVSGIVLRSEKEIELENSISELRSELISAWESAEQNEEAQKETEQKLLKLKKEMDLKDVLNRVCPAAREELLHNEEFAKKLSEQKMRDAFVLSIDIRRSTDLMLNAITPQDFAEFMIDLASNLSNIIKGNFGIFEKFTGDGILAFFPDFFTGKDAGYYCLQASTQSHEAFNIIYKKYYSRFKTTLLETGLGIGIDFGRILISRLSSTMNIIGDPVVYACRMSGAPEGKTYINNRAFQEFERKYPGHIKTQESMIEIKNVGKCRANCFEHLAKVDKIEKPEWLSDEKRDVKVVS